MSVYIGSDLGKCNAQYVSVTQSKFWSKIEVVVNQFSDLIM